MSGGVAHDFNNLLAVIAGNVSLLELDDSMPVAQRESVVEIRQASERAAADPPVTRLSAVSPCNPATWT